MRRASFATPPRNGASQSSWSWPSARGRALPVATGRYRGALNLEVSFPAVGSRAWPSQVDPFQSLALSESRPSSNGS
jgi:hypothetical protein